MSATSTAASSSLSRARIATFCIATGVAGLFLYNAIQYRREVDQTEPPSTTLHRSNAIHRRRRPTAYRPRAGEASEEELLASQADITLFVSDDEDETEPANFDSNADEAQPQAPAEIVLEPVSPSNDSFDSVPWAAPRNGQNMVSLLFTISEDATRRNAYVHRGTLCNGCGAVPIRGIRYRCANCADYDLCETCESQDRHYRTHVFYKIKVPITNYAPRQLQQPFYPGNPDHLQRQLPREVAARLTKETTLDKPEIEAYWEQWTCIANTEVRDDPDGLHMFMDRRTFDRYLIPSNANRYSAPNLIHDRMFAFYDQDGDGLISFSEYLQGLAYRKSKNKLKRIFQGFDINGDGYVDRKDFLRIFRSYYVLYKNMRKDILESMDESAVNGVDAHALIQGRQPLSSAFGRDGQFGNAHARLRGAGKQAAPDGDMIEIEELGTVLPDGEDHVDRRHVFRTSVANKHWPDYYLSMLTTPSRDRNQFIRNLTARISENNEVIAQAIRAGDAGSNENVPTDAEVQAAIASNESGEFDFPEDSLDDRVNEAMHERWRRRQFYTDEEEGVEPPDDWEDEEDIPRGDVDSDDDEKPTRPILSPRSRSSSKVRFAEDMDDFDTRSNPSTSSRSIPERWGGMEIADAERDVGKDVLYQVTQQAFNELLDNLFKNIEDEAINSLTSSQTREKNRHLFTDKHFLKWAEKVDKIENRNESLDIHKEDDQAELRRQMRDEMQEAIRHEAAALATVPIDLEDVRELPVDDLLAMSGYQIDENDAANTSSQEESDRLTQMMRTPTREPTTSLMQPLPPPQQSLAQSLTASLGRTVPAPQRGSIPRTARRGSETPSENLRRDLVDAFRAADPFGNIQEDIENADIHQDVNSTDRVETLTRLGRLNTDGNSTTQALASYRDPTLPQFRPNSVWPAAPSLPSAVTEEYEEGYLVSESPISKKKGKKHNKNFAAKANPKLELPQLQAQMLASIKSDPSIPSGTKHALSTSSWMHLFSLWQLEEVEKKARERGGWARIDFGEFESVLKMKDRYWKREREREEKKTGRKGLAGRSNTRIRERESEMERMAEYLGSWVELCIQ